MQTDGWPINRFGPQLVCYFFAAALFLAAHRAFISWESLFRPSGVSPPLFRAALLTPVRFRFAHGAFAAAESFAFVAADIFFPPLLNAERDKAVPRSEARRFSRVPICRRIESASSNDLRDVSISCEAGNVIAITAQLVDGPMRISCLFNLFFCFGCFTSTE